MSSLKKILGKLKAQCRTIDSLYKKNEHSVHVNPVKCFPNIILAPTLESVDFLVDCSLFFLCRPGIKDDHDIELVLGNKNQLSDGQKYQILKCCDYLQKHFVFPPSNDTPKRQCSFNFLNNEFLRYSPFMDGVFCVYCVLFSSLS